MYYTSSIVKFFFWKDAGRTIAGVKKSLYLQAKSAPFKWKSFTDWKAMYLEEKKNANVEKNIGRWQRVH